MQKAIIESEKDKKMIDKLKDNIIEKDSRINEVVIIIHINCSLNELYYL